MARLTLLAKDGDYAACGHVLAEALRKHPTRLLAFCGMPNHWHLVLWPSADEELTAFTRWLTHTHTRRWHAHRHTGGTGHLYQGRFKALAVAADDHLYTVLRYVERNALRANRVPRAEAWRWGSLGHRQQDETPLKRLLHAWPLPQPSDWLALVNAAQTEVEREAVRRAVARGAPFGASGWQEQTAQRLGLQASLRPRGRPRKAKLPTNQLF